MTITSAGRDWAGYYRANAGRALRPWLAVTLGLCGPSQGAASGQAIDLGCGDGTETMALLAAGWQVLAVDQQPEAIAWVRERVPPDHAGRLETQRASFRDAILVPADLIFAYASLPFCHPDDFGTVWEMVRAALHPGGRFAGQLFGVRDTWSSDGSMTFQTRDQAEALLDGLIVERFEEVEEEGNSFSGPKHWHHFSIVARRPAEE